MWLAFVVGLALGFFGSIPVAGPVSILVLKNALEKGSRQGIDIAVGAAVGEGIYALVAYWGLSAVLLQFPAFISISRLLGAVFVIALGLYLVFRRTNPEANQAAKLADRQGRRWLRGFASAVLNPTLLITWTTIVTGLHATSALDANPREAFPFGLGVAIGILGWFAFLVKVVAQRFRDRLQPANIDRLVRGIGWVMVGIGAVIMSRAVLKLQLS